MSLLSTKRHIFISHSHHDAEVARLIADDFRDRGLPCWLDQARLRVGQLYDERIGDAIANSGVVLVLVSRAAAASDYVKHEITAAVTRKIPIAPIFLEKVPKEDLKAPLDFSEMRVHALNFTDGKVQENLPRLAAEIGEILQRRRNRVVANAIAVAVAIALLAGVSAWIYQLQQRTRQAEGTLQQALASTSPAVSMLLNPASIPPAPQLAHATAATPGRPASVMELQFQIHGLREGDSQWTALSHGDALASGEAYFLHVQPRTDGHLYVFQQDSTGKLEWLFPQNSTSTNSFGENPVRAETLVSLPPEPNLAYVLDDNTGSEHFFAVLSGARWIELERALESGRGAMDNVPLSDDASQMLAARSKGIAGVISTGHARSEVRSISGRSLPATIQPIALRSSTHWLFSHLVIRHLPTRKSIPAE